MKRLPGWNSSRLASIIIAAVLVLVPFQGFLTVWGSSLAGHYLALRLWDEVALLALTGIVCYWLVRDAELRIWFADSLLVRLIIAYTLLTLLLSVISYAKGQVTPKALAYGVLVNLRYLAWFVAVLLTAQRSRFLYRAWPRLLLIPAAVVVVFAVLQFTVLPHDFLSHFGYDSATTIAPIETINHNAHFIRVQSTLRGANPLGAYLVVVLSALGVLYFYGRRKVFCAVFGAVALAALYATGSRSAWIGALISLGVIGWRQLQTQRSRLIYGAAGLLAILLAFGGYVLLKNNVNLQNEVLHTQTHSAVKVTSNGAHASALKNGVDDVFHQPFGDGPGTAGPASEYNGHHPARIAEDYYVQIAQEVGWLGLALFLSIFMLVAIELYEHMGGSPLVLVAFASFAGIAFVCLLSHAWADDTLAFVWWGLAGIALGNKPRLASMRYKISRADSTRFFKYLVGGSIYFWVAYGVFAVCYSVFHWKWFPAKVLSDAIGWTLNYLVQRLWAFSDHITLGEMQHAGRYVTIESIGFVMDYLLIGGLVYIGISPYIGFFISGIFFTFWSFLWYKYWVFPESGGKKQAV